MYQDILRSAVYSSLTKPLPVTKENGNQSVHYMTNRKSKHYHFAEVNTPPEGRTCGGPQSFMEEEKGNDSEERSHLQLFQASKGARELTQMIDSLSKAPNLDGRSKYIAKDLLRGAQDLQSSLVMLAKLQEASQSTSQSNVKGRQEFMEEEIDVERKTRSRRFAFQEPRCSADGPWMAYAEDKKKMSISKFKQRSEFVEGDIGMPEIKGVRRFELLESRHSVDGSSRNLVEEYKKVSLKQRPELLEKEIGVGEIMGANSFPSRKYRFSIDKSSRDGVEDQKRISQLKFKQRSEYLEEEIGAQDIKGSKRFGMQKLRFSRSGVGEVKNVSEFKLKQRSETLEEETGVEEIMPSKRFGLQEHRISSDRSSRDSIEELRRVIKDSLYRHNLLPESSNDELDSQSRSPRSSKTRRRNKFKEQGYGINVKLSGSVAATLQPNQAKSPNVISNLIGLNEVPSATVQTNKTEVERKKSLILSRPSFEIDRPNARKLQLVEKPNSTQKTLHEIIAAMQFKGLLKSGQGEDSRLKKSRSFDTSQFEKYSKSFVKEDDIPPIVIMKPLFLPHWERGEGQKNLLLDKISAKDEIHREEKDSGKGLVLSKTLERKELKSIDKANVEVSQKTNTLTTVAHKLQRRKGIKSREITDEEQSLLLDGKKEEEKEDIKKKRVPKLQTNTTYTDAAKPEKQVSTAQSKVSRAKPESKNSTSSVKEKMSSVKSLRKSKDGKTNNPQEGNLGKDSFSESRTLTTTTHNLSKEVEKEERTRTKDDKQEAPKALQALLRKTGQSWESSESAKEAIHLPDKRTTTRMASGVDEDLMCLLSSSRSFISQAQQLFQIDARQPVQYQRKEIGEDVMRNAKLYLDCGKELMVRKSDQHEVFINPMLQAPMRSLNVSHSLSRFAEEIGSAIKTLTSYSKVDDDATSEDNLHIRLESDLTCKETMANANWDIGWVNWVCVEEAGRVVGEVEEHILSRLISEVAQDLVQWQRR